MSVTRSQIRRWTDRASESDQYMLVHCDTFSYDYWSEFAESVDDAKKQIDAAREQQMHSIKEIYDLSADIEEQVNSRFAWNL